MLKKILPAFSLVVLLASCSSLRPLAFTNNNNNNSQSPVAANEDNKKDLKFLDISTGDNTSIKITEGELTTHGATQPSINSSETITTNSSPETKAASPLQLKYAQLLNTDADQIQDISLYQNIDDWYGTRYKLGGTTKTGIDCSAFVQTIFLSAFGITLPRTARDQYKATRRISRTGLQEGDLLFFNTRGGVSHVGIYLQNNKFVHASVAGVVISDMFEPYYVRHFIAAGRVAALNNATVSLDR